MIGGYPQDQKGGSGVGGGSSRERRNTAASRYFGLRDKQQHYTNTAYSLTSAFSVMS